jgi:hypothetical protein
MNLRHKLVTSTENFIQIGQLLGDIRPVFSKVLHGFSYKLESSRTIVYSNNFQRKLQNINDKTIYVNTVLKYLKNHLDDRYEPFLTKFTSLNIVHRILEKHKIIDDIRISYGTNRIIFKLYRESAYNYMDIIIKCVKVLSLLEFIKKTHQIINIYYAPVNLPKQFPQSSLFTIDNVNSGVTTHINNIAYITLFRREESDKVLLHELIHYLKLDFAMSPVYDKLQTKINNDIIAQFNITPTCKYINVFEAYTDSIAIIFNSVFNSILTKTNINDYFYTELLYISSIANKILKHSGFNTPLDITDMTSSISLDQSTSVFSYYILKYGILYNSDIILQQFFPLYNINWSEENIIDIVTMSFSGLKLITDYNMTFSNSMQMTHNSLVYQYNQLLI